MATENMDLSVHNSSSSSSANSFAVDVGLNQYFLPGYKPKQGTGETNNQTLNPTQYQCLMNMLNTHLTAAKIETRQASRSDHMTGTCLYLFQSNDQFTYNLGD
ncbi:uncharacterized protein LOC111385038 [Olea europaea var. sylvestris]|uniref:uncharacterized protein LOC111385038 n=1 Tax=Olea europaea var. sylvestris TaxID=158386 RepID=UPI000C1D5D72|nr:uncharacterized protein LOC111385038 [Olea europaea var. sylvestris]